MTRTVQMTFSEPARTSLGSQFRSLRDQVVDNLRERIIEGDLAGGHRLVERDLSDELEVSRITIREALQQLTGEGFVVMLPRRGSAVTEFGLTEVRNLLEVREPLDVLAARLAAERHDAAGAARLETLLLEARRALEAGDQPTAAAANVAFHEEIARCTDNALLEAHMSSLHGQLRRLFRITREFQTDHVDDHDAVLRAILARDSDRAAAVALEHIRSTTEQTLAILAEREVASGGSSVGP